MSEITVDIDTNEVTILGRWLKQRFDPTTAAAFFVFEVGPYLRAQFGKAFEQEGRKRKWAPLARRTVLDKLSLGVYGRGTLVRSGELRNRVTGFHGDVDMVGLNTTTFTIPGGSDSLDQKYVAHQLGKGSPGQLLPRRPMVELTHGDGAAILAMAKTYFMRGM